MWPEGCPTAGLQIIIAKQPPRLDKVYMLLIEGGCGWAVAELKKIVLKIYYLHHNLILWPWHSLPGPIERCTVAITISSYRMQLLFITVFHCTAIRSSNKVYWISFLVRSDQIFEQVMYGLRQHTIQIQILNASFKYCQAWLQLAISVELS